MGKEIKEPDDKSKKMKEVVAPKPEIEPKKRHRRSRAELEAQKKEEGRLTQTPNPLFVPILNIPFDAWADGQQIAELKLAPVEAEKLALPVTQLVEYYLPKLPEVAYAWGSLILISFNLLSSRIKLIKAVRIEREKGSPGSGKEGVGKEPPVKEPVKKK